MYVNVEKFSKLKKPERFDAGYGIYMKNKKGTFLFSQVLIRSTRVNKEYLSHE